MNFAFCCLSPPPVSKTLLESKSWSGICLAASFWYILYEHFGIDCDGRSSHSSRFSYFRKRKSKIATLGVRFEKYRVLLAEIYVCISGFGYLLKECPSSWSVERWWSMMFLLLFWISWFLGFEYPRLSGCIIKGSWERTTGSTCCQKAPPRQASW